MTTFKKWITLVARLMRANAHPDPASRRSRSSLAHAELPIRYDDDPRSIYFP